MKNKQGFTLIEVLLYLALFGLVFSGLFVSAFVVIENIGRNDTQIMISEEGNFLLATIERKTNEDILEIDGGFLKINGSKLNNSSTQVSNFKFTDSIDGGSAMASFSLGAKTASGKNYSHDFLTTYSLYK